MCEINSKTITTSPCNCQSQQRERTECEHGIMIPVNSDDPLSHHILKLLDPAMVCDYHCEQCDWQSTEECPAITQRVLLSLPRFLRVNITSPPTSEGIPEDFHQHGPLQEFERLNLSQLTPQFQPTQGQYVLRAAIMYSQEHHWTYLHGQSPIYVSDDVSRIATPEDMQEVALCARILIYEQNVRSEECAPTPIPTNPVQNMAAGAVFSPASSALCKAVWVSAKETAVTSSVFIAPALAGEPSRLATVKFKEQHQRKNKKSARIAQANTGVGPDRAAAATKRRCDSSGITGRGKLKTHPHQRKVLTSAPVTSVEKNYVEGSDRVDQRRQPRHSAPASPAIVQMPKQRLVSDFFPAAPGVLAAEKVYLDISNQGNQELLQGCSPPRKSKPSRFSPGSGFSQAQSNTGSLPEIFGRGVRNCDQPGIFSPRAPSPPVAIEIHADRGQVPVPQMTLQTAPRTAACANHSNGPLTDMTRQVIQRSMKKDATPWTPGTLGLHPRPRGAPYTQQLPTTLPIWKIWIDGLRSQDAMFKVADSISEDAFYIAADDWTRQGGESWHAGKRYGAFRSAVEFVTNMLEISSNRSYYEIIRENRPCKAYMDLEAEAGAMSAEEGKTMCEAVIREWNRRVRERWPVAVRECPQCQAHMLLHGSRNAGNGLKISYHIIFPWLVFPCNNGALREVIVTMSSMPEFQYRTQTGMLKPFIDPGVYTRNRQFRLLLNYKLPDLTRTALQLSQHPTLGVFVRACITQIQERAWHVPPEPATLVHTAPAAQTRQANTSCKPGAASPSSTPLIVAFTKLLHQQGQPSGQLYLVSASPEETKFRWQVQQNLVRPRASRPSFQVWRPTLAGHKSNGAWVSVDGSGAANLTCLHPLCQARGQSNRRPLGFVPLSVLHPIIAPGTETADSPAPSPTGSQDPTNGSITRKLTSLYPSNEPPDPRPTKVSNSGREPTAPLEEGQMATARPSSSRQRRDSVVESCDGAIDQQQSRTANRPGSSKMVQPLSHAAAELSSRTAPTENGAAEKPCDSRAVQHKKRTAEEVESSDTAQQQSQAAEPLCSSKQQYRAIAESCSGRVAQQPSSTAEELSSRAGGPTSIAQCMARISRENQMDDDAPLRAWTQEIGMWGGMMPGPCALMPPDTEHVAQATTDFKDWVSRSEQTTFTTAPPASLATKVLQELSREHSNQALENVKQH